MNDDGLRVWRSSYIDFYDDEPMHVAEVYTKQELQRIADQGFNAIWIHAILRDLLGSRVFKELAPDKAKRLRAMRTVINRAEKVGLKVMVYCQPPRGFHVDDPFWKDHPDVRGSLFNYKYHPAYALCTSTQQGKDHLHGLADDLVTKLPGLGGAIMITASEWQAHCFTHSYMWCKGKPSQKVIEGVGCPRCAERTPAEIISEILNTFAGTFREKAPHMRLMAWNWSWSFYKPAATDDILKAIDDDVTLIAGFERGGKKKILGKQRVIDEYSLGYAGPSERFVDTWKAGRKRGMPVGAKLQISTTHELATVPNLPFVGSIYEKVKAMRKMKVRDFMGCWNFGNMPTVNTVALNTFLQADRLAPRQTACRKLAESYMPGCDAKAVERIWQEMWDSMENHPFCIPFLYYSPVNYALGKSIVPGPLEGTSAGRGWMDDPRGDDLSPTFGASTNKKEPSYYTIDEIITGLGRLKDAWFELADRFDEAVAGSQAQAAGDEARSIRVAAHSWRAAWNQYRAYQLRTNWKAGMLPKLKAIMEDDLENTEQALPIVAADKRMGFHIECQAYLYDEKAMKKKIREMKAILKEA